MRRWIRDTTSSYLMALWYHMISNWCIRVSLERFKKPRVSKHAQIKVPQTPFVRRPISNYLSSLFNISVPKKRLDKVGAKHRRSKSVPLKHWTKQFHKQIAYAIILKLLPRKRWPYIYIYIYFLCCVILCIFLLIHENKDKMQEYISDTDLC